jgi:hypothetical protein
MIFGFAAVPSDVREVYDLPITELEILGLRPQSGA